MRENGFAEFERAMTHTVADIERRIAGCHHEAACPRCGAEVGKKCRSLRDGSLTKHPHRERWTQIVPAR
jgi:hypothetical protein